MQFSSCSHCCTTLVKVNGGSLRSFQKVTGREKLFRVRRQDLTRWIDICPSCIGNLLKGTANCPEMPFLGADGRMRTLNDTSLGAGKAPERRLSFARFKMTERALSAGRKIIRRVDATTRQVERSGSGIRGTVSPADALRFSEQVCDWGRGKRVWANMQRHNNNAQTLGAELAAWLSGAEETLDPAVAVRPGIGISGLGISFASKHLRMMKPTRFPVLDAVLSEGLGFALNPNGYALFTECLRDFKHKYSLSGSLASIEAGLFFLVKQKVGASD